MKNEKPLDQAILTAELIGGQVASKINDSDSLEDDVSEFIDDLDNMFSADANEEIEDVIDLSASDYDGLFDPEWAKDIKVFKVYKNK